MYPVSLDKGNPHYILEGSGAICLVRCLLSPSVLLMLILGKHSNSNISDRCFDSRPWQVDVSGLLFCHHSARLCVERW